MQPRTWIVTLSVAGALVAASLTVSSGPAVANNFSGATGNTGCTSTLNMADNNDHTFFYIDTVGQSETAANNARQNNIDPTDVNTSMVPDVTENTDVVLYDDYYTTYCGLPWSQVAGFTKCVSLSGQTCQKHEVRFNLDAIYALNDDEDRSLACHEFGHSLGLKHRQLDGAQGNGCMDNDHWYNGYTGHDKDHLNDNY